MSTSISKAGTDYQSRPAFAPDSSILWQSTRAIITDQGTVVLSALQLARKTVVPTVKSLAAVLVCMIPCDSSYLQNTSH